MPSLSLFQQQGLYLRAQVQGDALSLGLALGDDLQGLGVKLSRSPPALGLGQGWAWVRHGARGCVLSGECVCPQGRGWCGRGSGRYLDDVDGQLTEAAAVQPQWGLILGPALGLELQSSGHQLPHSGLQGKRGPLRVGRSPQGYPCQAPCPPCPPPFPSLSRSAPPSTGPGLTTSLERNLASSSWIWVGGRRVPSLTPCSSGASLGLTAPIHKVPCHSSL